MWVYSSGFPKSLDISKAIDKAAGAEREVVGSSKYASRRPNPMQGVSYNYNDAQYDISENLNITKPATPAAHLWQGYGTRPQACARAHRPCSEAPRGELC